MDAASHRDERAELRETQLRDGTAAYVWPLLPSDRRGLREAFEQLSPEARRARFLSGLKSLDDSMLSVLVDSVDGVRHVALVLVALPTDDADRPVGIARLIQDPADPQIGHVAFTVADDWRGRGVGTALGAALLASRPAGIRRLTADVAIDNRASLALLRGLGRVTMRPAEAGVLSVTVELED